MSVISMKQLLEAGVHFGHQTRRWNPKMAPYIYTERNGIHIIDLQKSVGMVDDAYNAIADIVADGGSILFVGTKKQAQDAIKTEAERCVQISAQELLFYLSQKSFFLWCEFFVHIIPTNLASILLAYLNCALKLLPTWSNSVNRIEISLFRTLQPM